MTETHTDESRTRKLEVAGHRLVETVGEILAQGNLRTLTVKSREGDVYVSVPLTAGAVVGGAVALGAPWIAMLTAVAALLTQVQVEVVYEGPENEEDLESDPAPTSLAKDDHS